MVDSTGKIAFPAKRRDYITRFSRRATTKMGLSGASPGFSRYILAVLAEDRLDVFICIEFVQVL
jgi:hypothetical protein